MNDVSIKGPGGEIAIPEDSVPYSAYQAIYHKLTKKTEKIIREYDDPYIINVDSISQLEYRISQLLKQYSVKGHRCEITHSHKDSYSHTYSSLSKFKMMNFGVPDCTQSLAYEFDFLIVLPSEMDLGGEIAQRYKISLIASQEYTVNDIRLPSFLRDVGHVGGIELKIEYSDYAVAQAIESCVTGWISSLKKIDSSPISRYILKYESFFAKYSPVTVQIIPLVAGAWYIAKSQISPSLSVSIALFCVALGAISYYVAMNGGKSIFSLLRRFVPSCTLEITEGDRIKKTELQKSRKRAVKIIIFILAGIIMTSAVNIFSALVYQMIFSPSIN